VGEAYRRDRTFQNTKTATNYKTERITDQACRGSAQRGGNGPDDLRNDQRRKVDFQRKADGVKVGGVT